MRSLAGAIARQRSFEAAAARAESKPTVAQETACASPVRAARPMVTGKIDDGHVRAPRILAIAESGERLAIIAAVVWLMNFSSSMTNSGAFPYSEEHATQRDFHSLKFTRGLINRVSADGSNRLTLIRTIAVPHDRFVRSNAVTAIGPAEQNDDRDQRVQDCEHLERKSRGQKPCADSSNGGSVSFHRHSEGPERLPSPPRTLYGLWHAAGLAVAP
jgi:hypothetical protein